MMPPFHAEACALLLLLDKESPADNSGQHKADGHVLYMPHRWARHDLIP